MNGKRIGQAAVRSAAETLFYLPLATVSGALAYVPAMTVIWLLTLPLCGALGAAAVLALPRAERRITRWLFACLGGAAHGVLLFAVSTMGGHAVSYDYIALSIVISTVSTLRGIISVGSAWRVAFPTSFVLYGLITHLLVQPLKGRLELFAPYEWILTYAGVAALILFFFLANERLVAGETEADGRKNVSAAGSFKKHNRALVAILVAALTVMSLFRQIQQAVERFVRSIWEAILAFINRPVERELPPEENVPVEPAEPLPQEEAPEPAAWLQLLEKALELIIWFIIIAGVLVLLFFIGKWLYKGIRTIADRLLERSAERPGEDEGYVDEVENLTTLRKGKTNPSNRRKRSPSALKWEQLTGSAERIRYLYRRYLLREIEQGYSFQPHLTPAETATDIASRRSGQRMSEAENQLLQRYTEVRYGDIQPEAEQAEQLKKRLDDASRNR
ncbi:DUF4129 domain-containing protein [Paenibacillus sp. NPDC058071]|uniref:DUF4129 domain-containing protein n=1 Tax=Paenibacillus sp. NPDC058071 TaxID=3346326 RepID=UPI0036D8C64D